MAKILFKQVRMSIEAWQHLRKLAAHAGLTQYETLSRVVLAAKPESIQPEE